MKRSIAFVVFIPRLVFDWQVPRGKWHCRGPPPLPVPAKAFQSTPKPSGKKREMKTQKHKPPEWREPAKHNIRIRNKIVAQAELYTKDATPEDGKRLRSFVVTCKRMGFRVFDGGRRS